MDKAYGRKRASCWGKPHKGKRTDANQATRIMQKREITKDLKQVDRDDSNEHSVGKTTSQDL